MSNERFANLHVGAPRVVTDMVHDVAKRLSDPEIQLVTRDEYRNRLRSLVNSSATQYVEPYSCNRQILVLSQHAALAGDRDLIRRGRFMQSAKRRLENLCNLFRDRTVTVHFAAVNFAVLTTYFPELSEDIENCGTASWFEALGSFAKGNPQIEIVVWDFDDPRLMAPTFLADIFERTAQELSSVIDGPQEMRRHARYGHQPQSSEHVELTRSRNPYTLERYRKDLSRLEELENVAVYLEPRG